MVRKHPSVSFEHAAALPVAATTALQALRDHGRIQRGQKVLINGDQVEWGPSQCRSLAHSARK